MKKLTMLLLPLLFVSEAAQAAPAWETSKKWVCNAAAMTLCDETGECTTFARNSASTIDFEKNTIKLLDADYEAPLLKKFAQDGNSYFWTNEMSRYVMSDEKDIAARGYRFQFFGLHKGAMITSGICNPL